MAARGKNALKKQKRRRHAETRKKDAAKIAAATESRSQQPRRA
jgi:hypothetical protein